MARKIYRIDEFIGIDQSRGENGLNPSFSPDACNMDTSEGRLRVADGFVRAVPVPVPGQQPIHRLYFDRRTGGDQIIVAAGNKLYAYKGAGQNAQWGEIYTFAGGIAEGRLDFAKVQLDGADTLLIASGEQQLVQYDGSTASEFGSTAALSDKYVGCLALYRSRLFAAGDKDYPNRLYWSKLPGSDRTIEDWGEDASSPNVSGGHTEIGQDADPITGLCAMSNQLLIFKRGSIYRLIGDKPGNFTIEPVDEQAESAARTALVRAGDVLYFLTAEGLASFNGVSAALCADARCIAQTLKTASVADSRGALAKNKLYFSIREPEGDALVEYDLTRRAYMLRRGFGIRDIAASGGRVYLINDARYVYLFGEGGTYDGKAIEAWWTTPETDLADKSGVKAMRELFLRGGRVSGKSGTLLLEVSVGGSTEAYRLLLPQRESEVLEVPLRHEGRTFRLRLSNEAGSRFCLCAGAELAFETWRRVE